MARRPAGPALSVLAAVCLLAACSSSGPDTAISPTTTTAKARPSTTRGDATTTIGTPTTATTTAPPCRPADRIRAWTLEDRAAQLVVVPSLDFALDGLAPVLAQGVGGVLFLGSAAAPADLADRIARARAVPTPTVAPVFLADQEGGGVQRMKGAVDPIPWPRTMGATLSPAGIRSLASATGSQLRTVGIDIDLAPVLDVDDGPGPSSTNPDGKRSFGGTAAEVTESGLAFQQGLTDAGVVPVVKHFPGLGHSTANTDHAAASTRPIEDLRKTDLLPFAAAIDAGAPAVMVANASVPGLTDRPAVVSKEVIDGLLRHELGFDGLVVTDSLSAEAITGAGLTLPQAAAASVEAGADLVLFGSTLDARELALLRPEAVATTLHQIVDALVTAVHDGRLSEDRLDEAVAHVLEVKGTDLCGAPG